MSKLLDKVAWINLLYDFYGQLLTGRQQDFMEFYYGQNLSLGEIAEEFNVTRQAVHDTLKRAEMLLNDYEAKLGLVARFSQESTKLVAAAELLEQCYEDSKDDRLLQVRGILTEILDMINK